MVGGDEARGRRVRALQQPQHGAAAVVHRADRLGHRRAELGHRFERRIGDQHELGRAEEGAARRRRAPGRRSGTCSLGADRQAGQAEAPREDRRLGNDGFGLRLACVIETRRQRDLRDRHMRRPGLAVDQGADAAAMRQPS